MTLKEELQSLLKGEVADDEATLLRYSHDASVFEVKPRIVVFPKDVGDVKSLVLFVHRKREEGLSLTCRAGGSDMTGGPLSESIVLDMTRYFNHIKEIAAPSADGASLANGRVEPGVFYRDFEKDAAKKDLLLPCFPASKELCTLGGMVANNAGGEKTLRYGKTENYVEQLKVVLADGNEYIVKPLSEQELEKKILQHDFEGSIYKKVLELLQTNEELLKTAKPKVSKNSAGYALWDVWDKEKGMFDITKLFVGSQGTLGIVTEIRFRLVKPKPYSALLVIFLKDVSNVALVADKVLEYNPESFESYDDHTLKFALKYFLDFLKVLKGNAVSLAFRFLPEFQMFLTGGFRLPKLILLAEFTAGSRDEAKNQALGAQKALSSFGVQTRVSSNPKEIEKYFTIRRESFNLLRHHVRGKRTVPFIDDIIVPPQTLPQFLPELEKILGSYPQLVYTIAGHVGDGNFHIIPLMSLAQEKDRQVIPELSKKVYDLVFRYKGSMTAEHNDGIIRTPFLEQMYGAKVVELFLHVKRIFDPANIFNPGKKVLGSMDYLLSHIVKE